MIPRNESSRHRTPALLCVLVVLLLGPSASPVARAAWTSDGVAVCTAQYNQNEPKLTTDGAGGAIVTWQDYRPGGHFDIYVQRVDGDGTPRWATNGVPLCTAQLDQKFPQIASDGAGGAVVVWKDKRDGEFDIYAQRIDATGVPRWTNDGLRICGATNTQQDPVVVSDGTGGVFIVWRDFRMGGMARLYAQRVNAAGVTAWAANGIPVSNVDGAWEPAIIPDGAGGAIFTWYDYRTVANNFDIYAQRIGPNGERSWGETGTPVCVASGAQYVPQLVSDGAGGALLSWWDDRTGLGSDIYAAHLTAAGTSAAGWPANGRAVCTAVWEQFAPQLVADGAGGAFITWYDQRDTVEIFAQRLSGSGVPAWAADGIRLGNVPGAWPVGTSDGNGGALIAWYGTPGGGTGLDVLAQNVTGSGAFAGGGSAVPRTVSGAANDQYKPAIVSDGSGGALVAWHDSRNDVGDIYLARISASLPNLNATATPDGFTAPVVPRDQPNASTTNAPLPPALPGNGLATWLNWGVQQAGGTVPGDWSGRLLLDGVPVGNVLLNQRAHGVVEPTSSTVGSFVRTVNAGPVVIRGGRHTLTSQADPDGQVAESDESDNSWSGQWIWAPTSLARKVGQVSEAPPEPGNWPHPNSDGYQFARNPGVAWVVSLAPHEAADDYNLYLYDDYSGSQSGFSNLRSSSTLGAGAVDFVVGHAQGTPGTLYPAAVRAGTAGGGGKLTLDPCDSEGRRSAAETAYWHNQQLRHRLADVYEGYFEAGETIYLTLILTASSPGLGINVAVFPATPGGIYSRSEALATATPIGGETWILHFTAPQTGWYPIVVHRQSARWVQLPLSYSFLWGSQLTGVDETPGGDPTLRLGSIAPNPMSRATEIRFALPRPTNVTLRLFDVNGRMIRTMVDGALPAGERALSWDGRDDAGESVAAGIYFARFDADGWRDTRRIIVSR